jgi:hypothetical protein
MAELPMLAADANPVVMGDRIRARVHSSLYEAAARRAVEERVGLVTFGHTHDAAEEALPGDGFYINSGTWTWRADFGGEGKDAWRDLFFHPERFTEDRKLSYVRIDYDEAGRPTGRLEEYKPDLLPELAEAGELVVGRWQRFVAWLKGLFGG